MPGRYVRELFDDAVGYVENGSVKLASYALSGTLIVSGCHKEKDMGLEVGKRYVVMESEYIGGDENPYTVIEFVGAKGPPDAKKKRREIPDVVIAAPSLADAKRMAGSLKGDTVVIEYIDRGRFYRTVGGEIRYNAGPGDIRVLGGRPEVKPLPQEPAKKPLPAVRHRTVRKPEPCAKAPDTVIIKIEQTPVVEKPVPVEKRYGRPVREVYIINNYCPPPRRSYYSMPRPPRPRARSSCVRCHF